MKAPRNKETSLFHADALFPARRRTAPTESEHAEVHHSHGKCPIGGFPTPRGVTNCVDSWTLRLNSGVKKQHSRRPCGSHSNIRTCSPIERFAEHPNSFRVSHLPCRENAGHLVGRPPASCAAPPSVRHTYRAPACLSPYRRHRAGRNYALGGSIVQCMADFAPRHRPNRLCT
jgi:hypothetical protein